MARKLRAMVFARQCFYRQIFRFSATSRIGLQPEDHGWTVPFWQSVPLPMQSLGSRYQAWRNAQPIPPQPDIALTPDVRRYLSTNGPWPHPRIRALLKAVSLQQLALPWIAPSLPWWPLGEAWKRDERKPTIDGKLLVFSRFRAVPVALSGLVSFALEARLLGKKRSRRALAYEEVTGRQLLAADPERPSLLALFHPSPILARLDPLKRRTGTFNSAKASVQGQLRALLAEHGHPGSKAHLPRTPPAVGTARNDRTACRLLAH